VLLGIRDIFHPPSLVPIGRWLRRVVALLAMTRRGEGGKGDEAAAKVMGPLFPRLHVSDAGKGGGPRAPPRNKMALYEQFTVPSSRFTSPMSAGGVGGGLAPSKSASQVSPGRIVCLLLIRILSASINCD
jgi:hypothetical protein